VRQKRASGRTESHSFPAPFEEGDADHLLERSNPGAERGLSEVEYVARLTNSPLARNFNERLEVGKKHSVLLPLK
jgi:hypothetical protein